MGLALLAFIAGVLTVLAPCVIPILPIILGSGTAEKSWKKPVTIILSLAASIFFLTILIKLLADSVGLRTQDLTFLTVFVLIIFGFILVFPKYWDKVSLKLGLSTKSDGLLNKFANRSDLIGHALIGFSLGPVFNSCSPTYLLVILPLLEQSLAEGIFYLLFYLLGLILVLSLVALLGFQFTKRVRWAYDPEGSFRKVLGVLFILIGISIAFGIDKEIEAYLLNNSQFYFDLVNFEAGLGETLNVE